QLPKALGQRQWQPVQPPQAYCAQGTCPPRRGGCSPPTQLVIAPFACAVSTIADAPADQPPAAIGASHGPNGAMQNSSDASRRCSGLAQRALAHAWQPRTLSGWSSAQPPGEIAEGLAYTSASACIVYMYIHNLASKESARCHHTYAFVVAHPSLREQL